ncbi:MAG: hypothetical protein HYX28_07385 [Candidatus Koribacter versatilis]|uniref:Uncharacterized protein n=1 Tax=Candidatus Korobacter versatilis TaxID=658062 RepID=A0A932A8D2_9BACT|nr:hypothetical protein [Candidatus Koribacter versatilis]
MSDDLLVRVLAWVESWGVWLSWLAWATVFFGALLMWRATRDVRGGRIWTAAFAVTVLAIAAHMADYVITLRRSPDLALELNPLWRNVVLHHGLGVAKWYGLTGKLLVSVLSGQMTALYLGNRARLFPRASGLDPRDFLRHMGERSATWRERGAALFTIFAFFFAGLTFFYFYIAYQNSITDPAQLDRLPSTPVAVLLYVVALALAFVTLTYRAYAAPPLAAGKGAGE